MGEQERGGERGEGRWIPPKMRGGRAGMTELLLEGR